MSINATISKMGSRKTEDYIKDIFEWYGDEVPVRKNTGCGKMGHTWWELDGEHVTLTYKNKRYMLYDKVRHIKVCELARAWEHAREFKLSNQSLEARD
jgi:hypothetical protein